MPNIKSSYRTQDGKAQIDWELSDETEPQSLVTPRLVFSATGEYDGASGQCLDDIAAAYPDDAVVQKLTKIWSEWHLNDMRAGTPEQEACVREGWARRHETHGYDLTSQLAGGDHFTVAREFLEAANLYEIPASAWIRANAKGGFDKATYKYGERWLFHALPDEVVEDLKSMAIIDRDGTCHSQMMPLHEYKARRFLHDNHLRISFTGGSKPARWKPAGKCYRVQISRTKVDLGKGQSILTAFDYWGSKADADAGKSPTEYDILACVSSEITTPETFKEFCAEFGSDTSRKLFNRANLLANRLRKFFSETEREQLQEIR